MQFDIFLMSFRIHTPETNANYLQYNILLGIYIYAVKVGTTIGCNVACVSRLFSRTIPSRLCQAYVCKH